MQNKTYTTEEFLNALYKAAQFKGGFDKITEPMVITDEDGVILFANEHIVERTGFSIAEIVGKTPGELWGNQKDTGFYEDMWQTIKIEKKPFTASMTNKRKDGTYYGCELKIEPILDEKGDISFFIGIELNFSDAI